MGGDHISLFGPEVLCVLDQVGVKTELQNGPGLGLARELSVDDFVGPRA